METIDKNKLIAIFVGYEDWEEYSSVRLPRLTIPNSYSHVCKYKNLKYHKSYDWIIPVAIKIQKEYDLKCINNPTCVEDIFNEVVRAIQFIEDNNIKSNKK